MVVGYVWIQLCYRCDQHSGSNAEDTETQSAGKMLPRNRCPTTYKQLNHSGDSFLGRIWVFLRSNRFKTSTGSTLSTTASIHLACGESPRAPDHIQSMAFPICKTRCQPPVTISRRRWLAKVAVLNTTQSVETLEMLNAQYENCEVLFLHYATPKVGISFEIVTQLTLDPTGSFNSIRWFEVHWLPPIYSPGRHAPETTERILT